MRNSIAIAILALFAVASSASAAQFAFPPFGEDLSFYQSFDNGELADLSQGKNLCTWRNGSIHFEPSLRGMALVCGKDGGMFRYNRRGNLDFDRSGTIICFYQPLDWEQDYLNKLPRLFIWGIESSKGYIGLQGANDPKTKCMCERPFHLMLLYGKRIPNKVYEFTAPGKEGCQGWHMLAFAWSGNKVWVKFDQHPAMSYIVEWGFKEEDFPAQDFSVGSASHWKYLLDEFLIYSRRLNEDELNKVYEEYFH